MASSNTMKSADRQAVIKKLMTDLKKQYRGSVPKVSHPLLETLLYAACYEDSSHEDAEAALQGMLDNFYDLNEIRVSSVAEIEKSLNNLYDAAWKALRIREALQHTFEKHFAFDLDSLRRKTQELASKELAAIPHQTPFIRQFALQHSLGAHVIPVDQRIKNALCLIGLSQPSQTVEEISEDLKGAVKKADGPLLLHLLKSLSVDPRYLDIFEAGPDDEPLDPMNSPRRLADLFAGKLKKAKPRKPAPKAEPEVRKTVTKKKPAAVENSPRKVSKVSEKQSAKPAGKSVSKTVTKKKPPVPAKKNTKRPK